MPAHAIEIADLRKSYGPVQAVQGISLTVAEGEVFALLGPNGAGKTTTVEILEGFRHRDSGRVSVLGFDPAEGSIKLKEQMGIVLQSTGLDNYLTVAETVEMFRGYYSRPRPRTEVLELVGLTEKAGSRVNQLSGGQKRRLDVAIALAGDPSILFLDEPTTGFDPGAKRQAWEVIKGLARLGKTIFLTSHSMDEVQYLSDRVVIINHGQIVAEGTPAGLMARHDATTLIRFKADHPILPSSLQDRARVNGDFTEIETDDPTHALHDLTSWAVGSNHTLHGLEVIRPSLEDVYLEITAEAANGEVASERP